jgi:hypothetical protein
MLPARKILMNFMFYICITDLEILAADTIQDI